MLATKKLKCGKGPVPPLPALPPLPAPPPVPPPAMPAAPPVPAAGSAPPSPAPPPSLPAAAPPLLAPADTPVEPPMPSEAPPVVRLVVLPVPAVVPVVPPDASPMPPVDGCAEPPVAAPPPSELEPPEEADPSSTPPHPTLEAQAATRAKSRVMRENMILARVFDERHRKRHARTRASTACAWARRYRQLFTVTPDGQARHPSHGDFGMLFNHWGCATLTANVESARLGPCARCVSQFASPERFQREELGAKNTRASGGLDRHGL